MTNGTEAASALRKKNRKPIMLPHAGIEITITALSVWDFIEARGELDIPAAALTGKAEKRQAKIREALEDPKKQKLYMDFFIRRGVLSPRVVADSTAVLDDDEILISDLGRDREFTALQIIELSGFGSDSEAVRKFREEETEERTDAGPGGEEVRKGSA